MKTYPTSFSGPQLNGSMTTKYWITTLHLSILIVLLCHTTTNSLAAHETSSIAILAKDNGLSLLNLSSSEEENLILAGSIFYTTDFYINRNGFTQLFWSDIKQETIRSAFLINSTLRNLTLLDLKDTWEIGNVAIDWLAGNLYWVVNSRGRIDVAKTDGTNHCTVVTNIVKPRALALDPNERLMFWSDWSDLSPRIERSTLAGGDRRSIYVVDDVEKFGWINAIALDRVKKLIYWVDAKSHSLHVSNYDGGNKKLLLKDENFLSEPFSLDFINEKLIWSKYSSKAVIQVNLNQVPLTPVTIYVQNDVFGVKILSSIQRQPSWAENECVLPSGGKNCSHLCLKHKIGIDKCVCPFGMSLKNDDRTCIAQRMVLALVTQTGKGHKMIYYKDPKDPMRSLSSLILKKESVIKSITFSHSQNLLVWFDKFDTNIYYRSPKKIGNFVVPSDTTSIAVAAHSFAEYVYITIEGEFPSISECSFTSYVCVPIVVENVYKPRNLILINKNLIWLDFLNGKQFIEKFSLKNIKRETVYTGTNICCLTSDVITKNVYWLENNKLSKLNLENNEIIQLDIDLKSDSSLLAIVNGFAYVKNKDSIVRQYDLNTKDWIFVSSAEENVTAIVAIEVSGVETNNEAIYDDLEAINQISIDAQLKKFDEKCNCVNGFCVDVKEGLICVCNDGYSGSRCDLNDCNDYCVHGTCEMHFGKPICNCDLNWFGLKCDSTVNSICAHDQCEEKEKRLNDLHSQFRALFLVSVPVIACLTLTTFALFFLWMRTRHLLKAVNNYREVEEKGKGFWSSLIFVPSILKTNEDIKGLLDDQLNLPNTNV